jgi:hypothetical protein
MFKPVAFGFQGVVVLVLYLPTAASSLDDVLYVTLGGGGGPWKAL